MELKNYRVTKEIRLEIIDDGITFFGYYNISPSNSIGDILYQKVNQENVRGSFYEPASIMLKKSNGTITKIAKTKTWNWQQGCMLQWYAGSSCKIIYNDYLSEEKKFVSIIKDIVTGKYKIIDWPIYSVSNSGDFALTLNFERLAVMRPDYGYFNRSVSLNDLPDDSMDGIWYINLKENSAKLILTLDNLKRYQPDVTMLGSRHKVNHIDISPDGKRFMFLHRWVGPQGRFMRLLTANSSDGSDLFYITGDNMVSHNCWWGAKDIISFCRLPDGRDRYVHFNDQQGFNNIIGENELLLDGHPSVSPDGKWLLTDDYPDASRFSGLYLYNFANGKRYVLGRYFQPFKFRGEKRIDLHPRWSPDGKLVSFDSGHNGKRSQYVINIESIMNIK